MNKTIQHLLDAIKVTNNRIEEFKKNEEFDPLSMLMGTETTSQKLYGEDVRFIVEVEEKIMEMLEEHKKNVNDIVFRR